MTQPGWYGEPGDAALERYWDGGQWTPQTRPRPAEAGTSLDLGPSNFEAHAVDRLAAAKVKVAAAIAASQSKSAEEPTLCISSDCRELRVSTGYHCVAHTALMDEHRTREQIAEREQMFLRAAAATRTAAAAAAAAMKAAQANPTGNAALMCPHCQTRGRVKSWQIKMKKGISGGKATGAVLTLGVSMLGTGLSRKERVTEMTCGNCKTVWHA